MSSSANASVYIMFLGLTFRFVTLKEIGYLYIIRPFEKRTYYVTTFERRWAAAAATETVSRL